MDKGFDMSQPRDAGIRKQLALKLIRTNLPFKTVPAIIIGLCFKPRYHCLACDIISAEAMRMAILLHGLACVYPASCAI